MSIESHALHPAALDAPREVTALRARPTVTRRGVATLPTSHGSFQTFAYSDEAAGVDHLALVVETAPDGEPPLVRVHSECITGEAFDSVKCECGPQLKVALELIQEHGGIVVYLRGHEGRGIGLANKIRAYQLQDDGADTLDANLALGLPSDARNYAAAAQILADLGVGTVRLLTNNPDKVDQLAQAGVDVCERIGLLVGRGEHNERYLATKRDRMGHVLPG